MQTRRFDSYFETVYVAIKLGTTRVKKKMGRTIMKK